MLFNSYVFIFVFLPITLIGFHLIGKRGNHRIAISWLVAASLFFYGWWNPAYLLLIIISILFNYAVGISLASKADKKILVIGISINLSLIAYYKYANFFIDNVNYVTGNNIVLETIILPLAISFFTFQQITYLVDAYRGETREYNFLQYCLFVTFFPQLIAGPIVHHKEMLPQFVKNALYKIKAEHLAIGLTIFAIGLFKKVFFADGIAQYATPVFYAAEHGGVLTFFEAWGGALAYSMQLYFDFSGYSDMALGIARMFGIVLPVNFFSPYKAINIIDFWRRWHITLSRFLRDYLYIALGGNRKGSARRYVNLFITMLLGGLWHGAGWTFVIWGGLHGFYLIINHVWHGIKIHVFKITTSSNGLMGVTLARLVTFFAVTVSWVVFRAESLDGAIHMYEGMLGLNGVSLPAYLSSLANTLQVLMPDMSIVALGLGSFGKGIGIVYIFLLLMIAWYLPNTLELMRFQKPALGLEHLLIEKQSMLVRMTTWRPNIAWSIFIILISAISILSLTQVSEFLYFQF